MCFILLFGGEIQSDSCALAESAVYGPVERWAEVVGQSPDHISHSDPRQIGPTVIRRACANPFYGILRTPQTVILHPDHDKTGLPMDGKGEGPAFFVRLQNVEKGVFHQRLDQKSVV